LVEDQRTMTVSMPRNGGYMVEFAFRYISNVSSWKWVHIYV